MMTTTLDHNGIDKASHYDLSGKDFDPELTKWADKWVAHKLGDFVSLEVFLIDAAATFVSLAARPDFAIGRRHESHDLS